MSVALSKAEQAGKLTKYDPTDGMMAIAVSEAAVKHFARARDAGKLREAIRAKLERQAEFVLWWDTQVEKSKGAADKRPNRPDGALKAGRDGIPDSMTISRWRRKLNDPEKFEQTFEAALTRYTKILEFDTTAHVGHNSGENEWYTPSAYIEAARDVMGGIDLDPASSETANTVVKAVTFYSAQANGLERDWSGRVWMNPPYSQPLIEQFSVKLAESVESGSVGESCVLVNNATETQWFQRLASVASCICFPAGRVKFWSPSKDSAQPLQGQALLYSGLNTQRFIDVFAAFGLVVMVPR